MRQKVLYKGQNYRIICVDTTNGREHDCSLFKNSKLAIKIKVDLGYQGIKKYRNRCK